MGMNFFLHKESDNKIVTADFIDMNMRSHVLMRILEILDNLHLKYDFLIYVNDEFSLCDEDEPYITYIEGDCKSLYPKDIRELQEKTVRDRLEDINKCEEVLLKLELDDIDKLHATDSVWFDDRDIIDLSLFRETVKQIFEKIRDCYIFYELM